MKLIFLLLCFSIFTLTFAAEKGMTTTKGDLKTTYHDIEKTLGIVPTFVKMYPDIGLPGAWEEYKNVQLSSETALSGKLKQLIGVGLAAQIPSKECSYMSTEFAKLNGANEDEMKEAVAIAAAARHWSTYLNGIQYDEAEFKKETNSAIAFIKTEMNRPETNTVEKKTDVTVMGAKTAYLDIEQTFGSVPKWMRMFPEEFIAGAWKTMKSVQLNPNTELSGKDKELIGLAISSQIPCAYCAYFHTEAAKLNGATDQEIREAITVAAVSRQWSTVLHGGQLDEKKFHNEIDKIVKYVKFKNGKTIGLK